MKRGIRTIADIRERCKVDPVSLCWVWQGATSGGQPKMHVYCHEHGDKRTQQGTRAAWTLAHGTPPPAGALVFRRCGNPLCLNPVHLGLARSLADIGLHVRRSGKLLGSAVDARRANAARGRAAQGIVDTPPEIVRAIRAAGHEVTGRALSRQFGVTESTVSKIRLGLTYREVLA